MIWQLFYMYVGVCLAMMASVIWRKEDQLQFPFLAGGAVLLMVCIPLAALMQDTNRPDDTCIGRFIIMAILCQLASWAGYKNSWRFKALSGIEFDSRRLTISLVVLTAIGLYFGYLFSITDLQYSEENGNLTGLGTIFITLSGISRFGFVLAVILYLRSKNWRFLLAMIPQTTIYARQFLAGRRTPSGEFVLILLTLVFFYRRKSLPLPVLATGMIFAAILSFNIAAVRGNTDQPFEERIKSFIAGNPLHSLSVEGQIEEARYVEILNGVRFMEAKALGGHYDCGLHFWNQLVFGFVPAQFVGADFKKDLQFNLTDDTLLIQFDKPTGTCESGIAEAFMGFGYFGCLLFFIMGACFRWLWDQSTEGNILCQFVFALTILPGLASYTIQLWTILNQIVFLLAFSGVFFWWSLLKGVKKDQMSTRNGPVSSGSDTLAKDIA